MPAILTSTERRVRGGHGVPDEVVTDASCECEGFLVRQDGEPGLCPFCAKCDDCGAEKMRLGVWHDDIIVDDAVVIVDGLCADCRGEGPKCPDCALDAHTGSCDPVARFDAVSLGLATA